MTQSLVMPSHSTSTSRDDHASRLADRLEDAEPLDIATLARLSPALVVAPHSDDESLGCGGLLALLVDAGVDVRAVLVTDGTASHPKSLRFDADARRALRNAEWREALVCLGVEGASHRLCCPDGDVPVAGDPRFASVLSDVRALLDAIDPKLVLLPWRRDPHADHRASFALVRAALADRASSVRCLEYIVWASERGAPGDLPRASEARTWHTDISAVRERKRRAIAAHRSQHGEVITDDPSGFTLSPEMRRRGDDSHEYFFESNDRT